MAATPRRIPRYHHASGQVNLSGKCRLRILKQDLDLHGMYANCCRANRDSHLDMEDVDIPFPKLRVPILLTGLRRSESMCILSLFSRLFCSLLMFLFSRAFVLRSASRENPLSDPFDAAHAAALPSA